MPLASTPAVGAPWSVEKQTDASKRVSIHVRLNPAHLQKLFAEDAPFSTRGDVEHHRLLYSVYDDLMNAMAWLIPPSDGKALWFIHVKVIPIVPFTDDLRIRLIWNGAERVQLVREGQAFFEDIYALDPKVAHADLPDDAFQMIFELPTRKS